ncbi:MAG: hypothetical protein ACKOFO_11435, partial [Gemmatimonadota bacterium]
GRSPAQTSGARGAVGAASTDARGLGPHAAALGLNKALGRAPESGQTAPGFQADLALFDVRDHREIPYWYGDRCCQRTWVRGRPAHLG